jgi:selenocysteine-specific elongation factor
VELLTDSPVLKSKSLIHFHLGTAETVARIILYGTTEVKAGEDCYCQFRLRDPVIAMSGDRYIVRRFSPLETIGGGEVLDPLSYRRSKKESTDDLMIFEQGTLSEKIAAKVKRAGIYGIKVSLIEGWIKAEIPSIRDSIKALKEKGILLQFEDSLVHMSAFDAFGDAVKKIVSDFHKINPLTPGILKEELRAKFNLEPRFFGNLLTTVKEVVLEKELIRLSTFKAALTQIDETVKIKIIDILEKGGFQPPTKEEMSKTLKLDQKRFDDILKLMAKEGSLVRISESMYVTSSVYNKMIENLKNFFSKKPEMTVAEFRDVLNTSRKYALPFLEYLDTHKITLRVGDIRKFLLK